MLDLISFIKALRSLKKAIDRSQLDLKDTEIRDAVIQRFEYCYELSWKLLKRRMKLDHPSPSDVDEMSFKEMFREASVKGLINSPEEWFVFRDQRNLSVHTYNEGTAEEVYETALEFYPQADSLLKIMEKKNQMEM